MSIDDPRLTAFALGELEPAEQAEIQALLAEDPAAAQEVAEMQAFASTVRTHLSQEEAPPLDEEQKSQILAEACGTKEKFGGAASYSVAPLANTIPVANWHRVWIPASLAACLAVAGVVWMQYRPLDHGSDGVRTSSASGDQIQVQLQEEKPSTPPEVTSSLALPISPAAEPAFPNRSAQFSIPIPALQSAPMDRHAADRKLPLADRGQVESKADDTTEAESSLMYKSAPAAPMPTKPLAAAAAPASRSYGESLGRPLGVARSQVGLAKEAEISRSKADVERRSRLALTDSDARGGVDFYSDRRDVQVLRRETSVDAESYDSVQDNAFLAVADTPLSTFSIDVDTASYSNVRRFLSEGQLPPKDAVRIEELVNYFSYSYSQPKEGEPLAVNMEVAACPWAPEHRLLRVGLKAREIQRENRPAANLVFLIDVSGSMEAENKLPLVKQSLKALVKQLSPKDSVGIAVYAGASGTVLEPTSDKEEILAALDRLQAGGSTNGAAGIRLAYDLAKQEWAKDKTNRVILATDGDFNVGTTSQPELVKLITEKARSGTFLSVLGFGMGNLKDGTMEKLADKGNGNYAYIDTIAEGRKVLVEQMAGTLITVAKDVKLQLEFNPAVISGYRLIGYENRLLAKEDFNDDKKDAGEVGAGHSVTALYELVPAGQNLPGKQELTRVDELKYGIKLPQAAKKQAELEPEYTASLAQPSQRSAIRRESEPAARKDQSVAGASAASESSSQAKTGTSEMLTLKLRWKAPDSNTSTKREYPLTDTNADLANSSADLRWAASVASFGMLLRDSPYKGQATWESTRELAQSGKGEKEDPYRTEFLELLKKAASLAQ